MDANTDATNRAGTSATSATKLLSNIAKSVNKTLENMAEVNKQPISAGGNKEPTSSGKAKGAKNLQSMYLLGRIGAPLYLFGHMLSKACETPETKNQIINKKNEIIDEQIQIAETEIRCKEIKSFNNTYLVDIIDSKTTTEIYMKENNKISNEIKDLKNKITELHKNKNENISKKKESSKSEGTTPKSENVSKAELKFKNDETKNQIIDKKNKIIDKKIEEAGDKIKIKETERVNNNKLKGIIDKKSLRAEIGFSGISAKNIIISKEILSLQKEISELNELKNKNTSEKIDTKPAPKSEVPKDKLKFKNAERKNQIIDKNVEINKQIEEAENKIKIKETEMVNNIDLWHKEYTGDIDYIANNSVLSKEIVELKKKIEQLNKEKFSPEAAKKLSNIRSLADMCKMASGPDSDETLKKTANQNAQNFLNELQSDPHFNEFKKNEAFLVEYQKLKFAQTELSTQLKQT